MTDYLLVSHGGYAEACLGALEMITGAHRNVAAVGLLPEDGPEQLKERIVAATRGFDAAADLVVFTDLFGGSPHNGAMELFGGRTNAAVVTGFSLPLVLDAVMTGKSNGSEIAAAGRGAIQAVREGAAAAAARVAAEPVATPGAAAEVVGVRIDARGIHGQVATAWIPSLRATRVMVIDAMAAKNEIQRLALRAACPETVKLSVLSPERAAERLTDPAAYPSERLFVVLLNPLTLTSLIEAGFTVDSVNLGNMPSRAGAEQLRRTVYLTAAETHALALAARAGIKISAQMVPNDPLVDMTQTILARDVQKEGR